ncbi:hypothetical protein RZO55_10410 [Clostridium boliviensis]|uniref:PrgI family protein n=1 Tax=Clostridium boliviensis TaxID=318465 RepID=A0ABU4GK44_9CLOT|nr:hypothetical protein [Clostridium boliviensis]MDW2797987.1 hypothetical protein [Clostridium boliviensis]
MEDKENQVLEKELYIPVPIPDSDDYISGIGQSEVGVIAIAFIISVVIGIFLSVAQNTIVGVSIGAFIIFMVITLIRRDMSNENLIKKIIIFMDYQKAQKKYQYVFKNEFYAEHEVEEDE